MPSFEPSLGNTTLITVPPSDQRRFAHLTFQLSFGQDEDDTGSWEIWTDLTLVREDGERVYADGAWHAMKFEHVEDVKEDDEGLRQHGSQPVFRLQPTSSHSAQDYKPRCFQARGVIVPAAGSAWSYTFRRVLPNGEVHWLGQEGGNGVVRVEVAEEPQSSSTPHAAEDSEFALRGVAVELPTSSLASPLLTLLPSESHVTADMIITIKTNPVQIPFYVIAYDAQRPQPQTTRPMHSVSIGRKGERFDVEAGSSPTPNNEQDTSYAETSGLALHKALQSRETANIMLAPVNGVHAADVSAFVISGSKESEQFDATTSHLVVYAAASSIDRLVWIAQPSGKATSSPLVVVDANGQHMLWKEADARAPVLIPSGGPVAQVLDLHPFQQLRGTGDSESIGVCVPGATSIEIGEEEIDNSPDHGDHGIDGREDAPQEVHHVAGEVVEIRGAEAAHVDADESSVQTEATPELEESIISQDEHHETKEPALWILKLVGRFLMNLLNALFSTFGFGQKAGIESKKSGGETDDDETEAGARTPVDVDERTPLLQSELSRSTTASGPLSDVLAPFSDPLAPLKDALTLQDGMITPVKASPPRLSIPTTATTDLVSPLLTPIEKRVQIRSYLKFRLPHTHKGYHCLLLPGSNLKGMVKVSCRIGDEWEPVEVLETMREGKCTEVQFLGVERGAEIEMETVH